MGHSSDLFLARRAAAGHADAWESIIDAYGQRLYNVAFQFAGRAQEAEDLCQEIFLKLYQSLGSYRGDVPLVAWALRLSRNLCIDRYRRSRRERRSTFLAEETLTSYPHPDDLHEGAERRQQLALVVSALTEMPSAIATVVLLRDLQGWSYEEVSAALEVPVGTVKSRLNRGRQELVARVHERLGAGGEGQSLADGATSATPRRGCC